MRRDSKCRHCIHRSKLQLGGNDYYGCLYILDEKRPRPCKAGNSCTEFVEGEEICKERRKVQIRLEGSN